MAPITVVLCDDHETFRVGMRATLDATDGIDVIGEAETGEAVVAFCAAQMTDVVLLDISMPGLGGIGACAQLANLDAPPTIVMVTASHEHSDVIAAMEAGALSYVVKDDSSETLIQAIREAADGRSVLSVPASTALVAALKRSDKTRGRARLSVREVEVLTLIGEGCSNREVASRLIISENTVKNHVRNILERLAVRSRIEAVLVGIREGLIAPAPSVLREDDREPASA